MNPPSDQFDMKRWPQENVRNGAWLDAQDFSNVVTAGELLEQRQCSPQCLLALNDEARGCSCRCGGKYHGSLLNAELPKPSPPWWEKALLHYPPDERARIYIDRGRVDKFNRWWAARKRDDMVAVWVRRVSSEDWTVVGDTWSSANWAVSVDTACWANAMFTMLLHARRVREVETWPVDRQWVDPGHFTLAGFSSQEEAVLVAAVVRECLWDNWAGANQCVGLLRDRFNLGHVEVLLPEK